MPIVAGRTALFVAGFALWALFSVFPLHHPFALHEGWDGAAYWSVGVPLLLAVQLVMACLSQEPPRRQPLWTLAGHFCAMALLRPAGSDLGMLPLAILFIALPGYGLLFGAAWIGRALGPARA